VRCIVVSLNCGLSDAKNISIAALFISIEKYHYLPKKVLWLSSTHKFYSNAARSYGNKIFDVGL